MTAQRDSVPTTPHYVEEYPRIRYSASYDRPCATCSRRIHKTSHSEQCADCVADKKPLITPPVGSWEDYRDRVNIENADVLERLAANN